MKKRSSSLLPWVGLALIVLAGLYIVGSVSADRSLDEARSALEKDGRPTSIEEIAPAEIAEEENAALVYKSVVLELKGEAAGDEDLFARLTDAAVDLQVKPFDPEALAEFRRLYETGAVAKALAAIEEGSMRPGYWNELDFSKGMVPALPHTKGLMGLARILAATMQLQITDGDHAGAWQTAATALRLANALEKEPLLLSQVIRAGAFMTAIESMRNLDYSHLPASRRTEIAELLTPFDDPAPFVAALDGERLLGTQFFSASWHEIPEMLNHTGSSAGTNAMLRVYQFLPPLRQRDRAAYSEVMRSHAQAFAEPYSPADANYDERVNAQVPGYCLFAKMGGGFSAGILKEGATSMFAESRVTRASLAVLDYESRFGTYPADLASLGRTDLADPFTGEPLGYKPDATGFTVFSVGPDFVANDGTESEGGGDDIVWRYAANTSATSGNSP